MRLPFLQAPPKIGFETGGSLVALLGVLGEELHEDGTQRFGACGTITGRCRLACNVTVDPAQGIVGGKWQRARENLVQGDAHRVEIAAGIRRAIHAAGLLRRHISDVAGSNRGRYGCLALARHLDAIPKPVSHTLPASSTSTFAG